MIIKITTTETPTRVKPVWRFVFIEYFMHELYNITVRKQLTWPIDSTTLMLIIYSNYLRWQRRK